MSVFVAVMEVGKVWVGVPYRRVVVRVRLARRVVSAVCVLVVFAVDVRVFRSGDRGSERGQ